MSNFSNSHNDFNWEFNPTFMSLPRMNEEHDSSPSAINPPRTPEVIPEQPRPDEPQWLQTEIAVLRNELEKRDVMIGDLSKEVSTLKEIIVALTEMLVVSKNDKK